MNEKPKNKFKEHLPIILIIGAMVASFFIYFLMQAAKTSERMEATLILGGILLLPAAGVFFTIVVWQQNTKKELNSVVIGTMGFTWVISWLFIFGWQPYLATIQVFEPLNGPYGSTGGVSLLAIIALVPACLVGAIVYFIGKPIQAKYDVIKMQRWHSPGSNDASELPGEEFIQKLRKCRKLARWLAIVTVICIGCLSVCNVTKMSMSPTEIKVGGYTYTVYDVYDIEATYSDYKFYDDKTVTKEHFTIRSYYAPEIDRDLYEFAEYLYPDELVNVL